MQLGVHRMGWDVTVMTAARIRVQESDWYHSFIRSSIWSIDRYGRHLYCVRVDQNKQGRWVVWGLAGIEGNGTLSRCRVGVITWNIEGYSITPVGKKSPMRNPCKL